LGCSKKSERLKNGLTRSAKKVVEYAIQIEKDSLDTPSRDTLLITRKIYGKNDQLIKQTLQSLHDDHQMITDYIYNSSNQIKQEIVKMSADCLPLKVNYTYKDSLLYQSRSLRDNKNELFEQVVTNFYKKDKTKKRSVMTQVYIDKLSKDTINYALVNAFYNKDENYDSTIITNLKKPGFKRKTIYKYNGNETSLIQEFDDKDSLVSVTKFEYKMDKLNNWIEKRIIKNETLKTIVFRKIEYK